jgi:hypothetical protein
MEKKFNLQERLATHIALIENFDEIGCIRKVSLKQDEGNQYLNPSS